MKGKRAFPRPPTKWTLTTTRGCSWRCKCASNGRGEKPSICAVLLAPGWERRMLLSFPRHGRAMPNCVRVCGCDSPRDYQETEGSQREQERRRMSREPICLGGSGQLQLAPFMSQLDEE